MQYSYTLAALAAGTVVLAAPAPEIMHKEKFQVNQVASGKMLWKNGPTQMMKTYNKFAKIGAVAPSHVQQAAAAAQQGSVAANPEQYDQSYLCPVTAGGSKLNLDFDTGSADLWVFYTGTPRSQSSGHDLYNPSTSGKLKSGYRWKISYGDMSGASGTVYSDKVVVGGVTATSQAVEAATSVSAQFTQDTQNDGLLGLAFSTINTVTPQQQTTFFDTVKSSLASPLFTVALKKGRAGTYDFGYIDSGKYTGSITYTAVDSSQGFWGFTPGAYSVGTAAGRGGAIGSSIADTGTTLLYLPDNVVDDYYSHVSGASFDSNQGGYTFPCSAKLPDFNVKISSYTANVPGSFINYAPVDNTNCFGGIQSSSGIGINIFGDIFLKSQFVVFDETTSSPRLGFAKPSSL